MDKNSKAPALDALIARVALRDQAAFRQLYDATSRCLLAIVHRLLRDQAWAEDVLQDVYVAVWNGASGYSPAKAQPMTWLMAVARNKALDALRSTQTERKTLVRPDVTIDDDGDVREAALPDVADERPTPLEQLLQGGDAQALRGCMGRALDAGQRQAIALAFFDGLSHSELAEHLQQPLGTVKAWVRRGLDRLKGCLERSGVEGGTPPGTRPGTQGGLA